MKRLGVLFGIITIAGGIALSLQASDPDPETDQETATAAILEEAGLTVTPEMERHSFIRNVLYFGGAVLTWGALALVLWAGWASRLRALSERLIRRRWASRLLASALLITLLSVLLFPLELYSGFILPHQFELSNQTFGEWLVEGLKGFAVAVVIFAPLLSGLLHLIDRWPRRWWLAAWVGTIPLTIVMVFLAPVVIEPLFNDFTPLENAELESRLLSLAEGVGIESSRVFEVDKSRQTRTLNAYVTGIGASKRIVIWDTLLDAMDDDEVVFVMAHEMGHYVKHHLWKGMAFSAALSLVLFWIASRLIHRGFAQYGERWGARDLGDPAALPWILLVGSVLMFLASPAANGFSRSVEHQADLFALEHTGLGRAGAGAFAELSRRSKSDPDPNPLIRFWRYSHPTIAERIRLAIEWENRIRDERR